MRNIFTRPTDVEILQAQLADAKAQKLEHASAAEFHTSMTKTYEDRIKRLTACEQSAKASSARS